MAGPSLKNSGRVLSMDQDNHDQRTRSVAVDFDGTLSHYEHFEGPDILGPPITEMVEKVKALIAEGVQVTIFTARVNPNSGSYQDALSATLAYVAIVEWSKEHLGMVLPVTHEKSREWEHIIDDRAIAVIRNTGVYQSELLNALS